MRLFYTIGIWFYTLGVHIAALCGHKHAALMVRGWKAAVPPTEGGRNTAWFHAASLGEFEQARPVLEEYRRRHPDHRIVLTFFSPSGYEVRKNYAQADVVCYLPPDLPCVVRRFLDTVQPSVAFFVKYEFWYNYLGELRRRGVPTYIFSAIFRPGQYFFKPWGGWFRRQLRQCYTHIFVQNTESLDLLKSHGIAQCTLAGDTRFDRVHQIALQAEGDKVVDCFLEGYTGQVLVCGSTWPPDEELLQATVNQENIKLILAPHVIAEEHLKQIEALFPDSIRYSQLNTEHLTQNTQSVLVIDNIGLLSKLYRYASVAYIGGGFGVGIHNILEAVTFGKPVLFGSNYHKFQEARDIIERGGGWSVGNAKELDCCLAPLLTDPDAHHRASQACTDYMQQNLGSTDIILSTIEK